MASLIVEQQDMAAGTLHQLLAHGLVEDVTLLRLDFHYDAPGQAQALDLANFLTQETDYAVTVDRAPRLGLRRRWVVAGQTQKTAISSQIVNDWIRWMVLAGAKHGECRFDGWGAFAPA